MTDSLAKWFQRLGRQLRQPGQTEADRGVPEVNLPGRRDFFSKIMDSKPDKAPGAVTSNIAPAPAEDLIGQELLTYEVAGDGNWFRMRFTFANGKPGSLSLPTECLHPLSMTLPRMMTQALAARYGDDSLLLVYPAEAVRIERVRDPNRAILASRTADGLALSFPLVVQ